MRKLVLVRGIQGSGKSTFIKEMGLDHYALSLDRIRQIVAAPTMTQDGRVTIAGEFDEAVVRMSADLQDARMRRGETLVMEQAIMLKSDIDRHLEKANRYRYDTLLIDFSGVPIDLALSRNLGRIEIERVPERGVRRTLERLNNTPTPDMTCFAWSENLKEQVQAWLELPVIDLSRYREIVHIGDLQGCFSVLAGSAGPLRGGLDPDVFYIFTGDLLDRGIENGQIMKWFMGNACGKTNVALLFGNHETHLERWAMGEATVSAEFGKATLPQLLQAGITRADAARLVAFTQDMLLYDWRGNKVMVTHAGLPTVPAAPHLIGAYQCHKGTGMWADPVDERFSRMAPDGWVQVHGHHNDGPLPVQASARSFNLEDAVEHGGSLRLVHLSEAGWSAKSYPNRVFKAYRERDTHWSSEGVEPWWMKTVVQTKLPEDILVKMREHPGVHEKTSSSSPHIASMNFTRDVFFNKSWDEVVIRARGLFFDTDTREVVARAYDKFFNLDERADTKLEAVLNTAKFPVTGYRKDNGFLGLIGYDASTDNLFFSSKSTPDSEFTQWFRDIFKAKTTNEQQETLRRWLRDMEACVALEVIDPVHDPHIIEYAEPALTLLDVFQRGSEVKRVSYAKLEALGKRVGLTTKARAIMFRDAKQLAGWHARMDGDLTYRLGHHDSEGIVLEDAAGFMLKIKFPRYAFWKTMRSAKNRLGKLRRAADDAAARGRYGVNAAAIDDVLCRYGHPLANSFLRWALTQATADMDKSIIELRKAFIAHPDYDPGHETVRWAQVWRGCSNEAKSAPSQQAPNPVRQIRPS